MLLVKLPDGDRRLCLRRTIIAPYCCDNAASCGVILNRWPKAAIRPLLSTGDQQDTFKAATCLRCRRHIPEATAENRHPFVPGLEGNCRAIRRRKYQTFPGFYVPDRCWRKGVTSPAEPPVCTGRLRTSFHAIFIGEFIFPRIGVDTGAVINSQANTG